MRLPIAFLVTALWIGVAPPALAQNQATPEQRIERLENQLRQVQGRVFVRGQPADTAGFGYEPAATQSSVTAINDRLAALERQMADILRQSEENGNRLGTMEGTLTRLRSEQEERLAGLERRLAQAAAVPATEPGPDTTPTAAPPRSSALATAASKPTSTSTTAGGATSDPAEDAYTEGFRLWETGNHGQAITSLRAFVRAYPKHRRVSFANNLIGRALLDSGQARAAAEALLGNYRSNPRGERAPDSLYYLGQSLMKLGQPGQACKAYAELEDVYGGKIRPDLAKLLPPAKAQASCS